MRGEASSDVFKLWLYAAASVLLGAWISPLAYNAGKALAEVSSVKTTNGPLEWLAGICQSADFPAFFQASIVVCAVLFFLPFVEWLRGGRNAEGAKAWSIRLPEGSRGRTSGQPFEKNPDGMRQAVTGFLLVATIFLLIAGVLILAGVFTWRSPAEPFARIVVKALFVATALGIFQEIVFRGIAMGIFLRAMRPAAALGMTAVFFALVHCLAPGQGVNVLDPDGPGIGFELLRKIAAQFSEPRFILGTFTPLVALGGVLSYSRWRTSSLYLPIGLHTGWIFINLIFGTVTTAAGRHDSIFWVFSGASLRQGLVSLFGILIAGVLANFLLTDVDDPATADTPT